MSKVSRTTRHASLARPAVLALPVVVLLALAAGSVDAEVFVLTGDIRVVGELLNPDENPRKQYMVRTPDGQIRSFDVSRVKQILPSKSADVEYERIRPRYADTPEELWKLAEWCRVHRLLVRRNEHLERILQLDPNHADARKALGYALVEGRWLTRDQYMEELGYVRFEGDWCTSQEIELRKREKQLDEARGEWTQNLRRWQGWLGTDKDPDARRGILSVSDPNAVDALDDCLKTEKNPTARLVFVEALAKVGTPSAGNALTFRALADANPEVRLTCLDYLKEKPYPGVINYFIGQLKAKDNQLINRAGLALGEMEDPAAIAPLIEAVVTSHKFKITSGSSGSISPSFGSGGSGFSAGSSTKIISRDIPNQAVLEALQKLTGNTFGYDKEAWKEWYASRHKTEELNFRRDELDVPETLPDGGISEPVFRP